MDRIQIMCWVSLTSCFHKNLWHMDRGAKFHSIFHGSFVKNVSQIQHVLQVLRQKFFPKFLLCFWLQTRLLMTSLAPVTWPVCWHFAYWLSSLVWSHLCHTSQEWKCFQRTWWHHILLYVPRWDCWNIPQSKHYSYTSWHCHCHDAVTSYQLTTHKTTSWIIIVMETSNVAWISI